jgi:hypothetical protein
MKSSSIQVLLILSFLSTNVFAVNDVTKHIANNIFEDSNVCNQKSSYFLKTNEECAVKKVRYETVDYSIQGSEDKFPYYGTLGYFGFETNSWSDITNYGFVQEIRGCTYDTKKNEDGTIFKRIGETIMHLGKKRIFTFPDWSIDAGSTDPLYYGPLPEDSNLPGGRLALYRWTPNLKITNDKKTKDLYEILKLPANKLNSLSPSIFVKDAPSMAYFKEGGELFQNVSLEFKICLYNLKDIPESVNSDDPINAVPISCHLWNSQFEFDFKNEKYQHLPNKGLDTFCATQAPVNPAEIYKKESGK